MNEYINSFDVLLEKDELVCLSSGVPLNSEATEFLLSSYAMGKERKNEFVNNRINESFHDPIHRCKISTFKVMAKKTTPSSNMSIEVNRDILGRLLSTSLKESKTIDFVKALHYPLCEVPLSLTNADGTMRKTNKSKLASMIISNTSTTDISKQQTAYIIDVMAYIRTMVNLPDTYERLAWQFLSGIPKGFSRIDLVADSYFSISIKNSERIKRGTSKKIIVKSMKSKLSSEFGQFMSCGENKSRLIELLFEVIKSEREDVLEMLRCDALVLSRERECKVLTHLEEKPYSQLLTTQEEADTKIIAHAVEFLHQSTENKVVIRSPSGDTDILVLSAALLYDFKEHVLIDNGSGQARKCIDLRSLQFSACKYSAMLGLHAFTGNDYLSSFFRKGKENAGN